MMNTSTTSGRRDAPLLTPKFHMFGMFPICHGRGADSFHTSTGSPDPSVADMQGSEFYWMPELGASIQSNAAQSRQEVRNNIMTSSQFNPQ